MAVVIHTWQGFNLQFVIWVFQVAIRTVRNALRIEVIMAHGRIIQARMLPIKSPRDRPFVHLARFLGRVEIISTRGNERLTW